MMAKRIVTGILIGILIAGCGKTKFRYDYPRRATVKSEGYVIACHRLTDQGENTDEIKKIFATDPLLEMDCTASRQRKTRTKEGRLKNTAKKLS
jgi:hypothetical protein